MWTPIIASLHGQIPTIIGSPRGYTSLLLLDNRIFTTMIAPSMHDFCSILFQPQSFHYSWNIDDNMPLDASKTNYALQFLVLSLKRNLGQLINRSFIDTQIVRKLSDQPSLSWTCHIDPIAFPLQNQAKGQRLSVSARLLRSIDCSTGLSCSKG